MRGAGALAESPRGLLVIPLQRLKPSKAGRHDADAAAEPNPATVRQALIVQIPRAFELAAIPRNVPQSVQSFADTAWIVRVLSEFERFLEALLGRAPTTAAPPLKGAARPVKRKVRTPSTPDRRLRVYAPSTKEEA